MSSPSGSSIKKQMLRMAWYVVQTITTYRMLTMLELYFSRAKDSAISIPWVIEIAKLLTFTRYTIMCTYGKGSWESWYASIWVMAFAAPMHSRVKLLWLGAGSFILS